MQKFKKIVWFIEQLSWALMCVILALSCFIGFILILKFAVTDIL